MVRRDESQGQEQILEAAESVHQVQKFRMRFNFEVCPCQEEKFKEKKQSPVQSGHEVQVSRFETNVEYVFIVCFI